MVNEYCEFCVPDVANAAGVGSLLPWPEFTPLVPAPESVGVGDGLAGGWVVAWGDGDGDCGGDCDGLDEAVGDAEVAGGDAEGEVGDVDGDGDADCVGLADGDALAEAQLVEVAP